MTVVNGSGGCEWDARQFAAEVGGVAVTVLGVVQDGVDVMEDVPLGNGRVVVVGAELFEGPVSDVLAAVAAVFGVGVEGEALSAAPWASKVQVGNMICYENHKWLFGA